MEQEIPQSILKFFWGDNTDGLSLKKNKRYIVQTLLEKGDIGDIKWLFSQLRFPDIKLLLPEIKLSNKSAHFWNLFFKVKI